LWGNRVPNSAITFFFSKRGLMGISFNVQTDIHRLQPGMCFRIIGNSTRSGSSIGSSRSGPQKMPFLKSYRFSSLMEVLSPIEWIVTTAFNSDEGLNHRKRTNRPDFTSLSHFDEKCSNEC
jgi:hypothetical protein